MYPETMHGRHARGKDPESGSLPKPRPAPFAKDTAAKTGRSRAAIAEDVQIAQSIPEALRDAIRPTPLADSKTDLVDLAQLEPEVRQLLESRLRLVGDMLEGGLRAVGEDSIGPPGPCRVNHRNPY